MTPIRVPSGLNISAAALARRCAGDESLRIAATNVAGATVLDFGVDVSGGVRAGVELAHVCLAGLGAVAVESGSLGGRAWPCVTVQTDWPVAACLLSQYAGWQIAVGKFFAMGSGPMRAVAGVEPLFEELNYAEQAAQVVGVLESGKLPDEAVVARLVEKLRIAPEQLILCVARTASIAGTVQVVSRSVETALHKLHELKFDVTRVQSGFGTTPLPPIAADDLAGIGVTNDAILYGGSVTLWVTGDDGSIETIGPSVPSSASPAHGRPFRQLFEDAGGDFYKIDPMLFSPAEVTFCNLSTGRAHRFGRTDHAVLKTSFGL
ncbi:MAG: methenyltetrahydromethanopterin cyclohydrolase [Planctomycetaceae bacterium]